jgi:hypothetical protein
MLVAPPTAKPNDRRRSPRDRDVGFRPLGKLEQIASLGRVRSYELRQVADPRPFRGGCHPGNYTVSDAMLKVMAESVRSAGSIGSDSSRAHLPIDLTTGWTPAHNLDQGKRRRPRIS